MKPEKNAVTKPAVPAVPAPEAQAQMAARVPGNAKWPDQPKELLGVKLDAQAAQEIFGTDSALAMLAMAHALEFGIGKSKGNIRLELAFNMIQAINPKDATEALLVQELVMLHEQAARMLAISRQEGLSLDCVFKAVAAARELSKTFQAGMDALSRHRSGGKQQVVVSHVNVSPGAQAAVAVACEVRGGQADVSKRSTP